MFKWLFGDEYSSIERQVISIRKRMRKIFLEVSVGRILYAEQFKLLKELGNDGIGFIKNRQNGNLVSEELNKAFPEKWDLKQTETILQVCVGAKFGDCILRELRVDEVQNNELFAAFMGIDFETIPGKRKFKLVASDEKAYCCLPLSKHQDIGNDDDGPKVEYVPSISERICKFFNICSHGWEKIHTGPLGACETEHHLKCIYCGIIKSCDCDVCREPWRDW